MNYKDMIAALQETNLCTWFMLPLTGLTRSLFGEYLVNTYLERMDKAVIIQTRRLEHRPEFREYIKDMFVITERGVFLKARIPEQYHEDVHLFTQGLYSQMSDDAKKIIRANSGLLYADNTGSPKLGHVFTDFRLIALDKGIVLREFIEHEFGVSLPRSSELLSKPPDSSFMDLYEV